MANTIVCTDTSEAIDLLESQSLYLKPIAKVNVCVQLPQIKTAGKAISNWEVMEKLKHMVRPEIFLTLKISKSTLEFIRLEGEIENKSKIHNIILKLDGKTIKLSGFTDILKVRAAEAKVGFPSRHDWDSYFRDAKNMNEMRAGERPDTVHLKDLPTRWFASRHPGREGEPELRPSEKVVRKVFSTFGEIRCIDIPMLDPYRKEISTNLKMASIQTFSYGQDLTFECYIQYMEYISFVKAMDSLRGMKLLFKGEEKALTANVKVDFDKTKHLSEKNLRRRRIEREKLEALEQERMERVRREKQEEERKKDDERRKKEEEEREKERKRQEKLQRKEERRKEREEKRRQKKLEKKQKEEEARMQYKIALEERRLLIAQRKLESLRLLTELFERVKAIRLKKYIEEKEKELEEERRQQIEKEKKEKEEEERKKIDEKYQKKIRLEQQEKELRDKILKNFKAKEEQKQETQREELRKKISGSVKLKSAVIMKKAITSAVKRRGKDNDEGDDDNSEAIPKDASDNNADAKKKRSISKDNVKQIAPKKSQTKGTGGTRGKTVKTSSIKPVRDNRRESSASSWSTTSEEEADNPSTNDKELGSSVMERVLKANKMRAWQEPGDDIDLDSSLPGVGQGPSRLVTIRRGRGRGVRGSIRNRPDMPKRVIQKSRAGKLSQIRVANESRDNLYRNERRIKKESEERNDRDLKQGNSRSSSRHSRDRDHRKRSESRGNHSRSPSLDSRSRSRSRDRRSHSRRRSSSHDSRSRSRERRGRDSRSRSRERRGRDSRSRSRERRGHDSRSRSRERRGRDSRSRSRERRARDSRSRSGERRRHDSRDRRRRRHSPHHEAMPPMVPGPNGMMIPLPPGPHPMMIPPFPMPFRPPFHLRGRGGRPPLRMRGKGMRGGRFPPPPPGFGIPLFNHKSYLHKYNHFMGAHNQMKDISGRYAQPLQVDFGYKGRHGRHSDDESHSRSRRRRRERDRRRKSRSRSHSYSRSRSRTRSRSRSRSRSGGRRHDRSHSSDRSRSRSRSRDIDRSKEEAQDDGDKGDDSKDD